MFTGLVQGIATIKHATARDGGLALTCASDLGPLVIGESVAHAGICLTIARCDRDTHDVFVGAETLRVTTASEWREGQKLNVERALRVGDLLGGHWVSGHVDGIGTVAQRTDAGGNLQLAIRVAPELGRYCVAKGSITIDGVSLTINRVDDEGQTCRAHVALIPHTRAATTLDALSIGQTVNIEVDAMGKWAERLLAPFANQRPGGIS